LFKQETILIFDQKKLDSFQTTMSITIGDKILIASLLILNVYLFANWGAEFSKGDWVVIQVDQNEVARLDLTIDQTIQVKGPLGLTEIEVKKEQARIVRSPCKNKICIKSVSIADVTGLDAYFIFAWRTDDASLFFFDFHFC
jgi:hypothetical protein